MVIIVYHTKWSPAVEEYYRSIERPFEETRKGQREEESTGFLKGVSTLAFFFSLIPLVPYVLSLVVPKYLGVRFLEIWGHQIPLSSFWYWWPTSFAITLILLVLSFSIGRPSDEDRARRLSPAQMRFAYCYALLNEVKQFQRNRLKQHIERASTYLEALGAAILRPMGGPFIPLHPDLVPSRVEYMADFAIRGGPTVAEFEPRDFSITFGRPRWFRLEPQTQQIVEAILQFMPKFRDRLSDKKDLPSLVDTVSDLAIYLYSEIPETGAESREERKDLEQFGDAAMNSFSLKVHELAPYRSEPKPETAKEGASRRFGSVVRRLSNLFVQENVLVRFGAWYSLSLALIVLGFAVAFRYAPALKVDTVILSAIVGGPVATAITAVAAIGRPRKQESRRPSPPDEGT